MAVVQSKRLPTLTKPTPLLVVWEMTLRCDQHCRFCGTRAGRSGPDELTTEEALRVVADLAEMGTAEVAIHGGEAYLRSDWLDVVRAIRDHGMDCTMVTGGRGFTQELANQAKAAGITAISVSIDGTEVTHDALRGHVGSHASAVHTMGYLRTAGVPVGCNTQINRANFRQLDHVLNLVVDHEAYGWQVQLMVPMGRAAEASDLWLQPYDMLEVMPRIADARKGCDERGIRLWPGNNVGYFGPFEHLLRSDRSRGGYSSGCGGGIRTMGIEANGDIKPCSAMGSDGFVGGNVRRQTIKEIWEKAPKLQMTRSFVIDSLWGFCRECYYGEYCKGGCLWTAATLLGKVGNNPYCHHRALEILARGQRERMVLVRAAEGRIRDTPCFALELEDAPADWVESLPVLEHTKRVESASA